MRYLLILLYFPLICFSQEKQILPIDYSLFIGDGEVTKFKQSKDTLFQLHGNLGYENFTLEEHYKIIASEKMENYFILELEQLNSELSTEPLPEERFSVWVFKDVDKNSLGYLNLKQKLTKDQLDSVQVNVELLKDIFFFTFFSNSRLREFDALKKITTKEEVLSIVGLLESEKYKKLISQYLKLEYRDMYGTVLTSELLNRACIEVGHNPFFAVESISHFMKN